MNRAYPSWCISLLLGAGLGAAPAWAGNDAARGTVSVVVAPEDCLTLADAVPALDSDAAAYRPGVDAYGRPVVPAEGPAGAADVTVLDHPVRIELTVDVAERLGMDALPGASELRLGTLTVHDDGRVYLDGRALAPAGQAVLWDACRRLRVLQRAVEERKP